MSVSSSIPSATTPAVCSCGAPVLGSMAPVSRFAYQRFVRKRFFAWSPSPGVRVYLLPCSCYLWVYATGSRFLCTLPF